MDFVDKEIFSENCYLNYRLYFAEINELLCNNCDWLMSINRFLYDNYLNDYQSYAYIKYNSFINYCEKKFCREEFELFLKKLGDKKIITYEYYLRIYESNVTFPILFRVNFDDYTTFWDAERFFKNFKSYPPGPYHLNILISLSYFKEKAINHHLELTDYMLNLCEYFRGNLYGYISIEDPSVVYRYRSISELKKNIFFVASERYGLRRIGWYEGELCAGIFWANFFNKMQIKKLKNQRDFGYNHCFSRRDQNNTSFSLDMADIKDEYKIRTFPQGNICIQSNKAIQDDLRLKRKYKKLKKKFDILLPDNFSTKFDKIDKEEEIIYWIRKNCVDILGGLGYIFENAPVNKVELMKNGDIILSNLNCYPIFDYSVFCFLRMIFPIKIMRINLPNWLNKGNILNIIYRKNDKVKGTLYFGEMMKNEKTVSYFLHIRKQSSKKLLKRMKYIIQNVFIDGTLNKDKFQIDSIEKEIFWNVQLEYFDFERTLILFRNLEELEMSKNVDYILCVAGFTWNRKYSMTLKRPNEGRLIHMP